MEDIDILLGKNENTAAGYFYSFYTRVCLGLPQISKVLQSASFPKLSKFCNLRIHFEQHLLVSYETRGLRKSLRRAALENRLGPTDYK